VINQGTAQKPDVDGVFRPGIPSDTQEVMRLFAIAARVVCLRPDQLEEVDRQLEAVRNKLVPPEANAAKECRKLWRMFSKVALLPKTNLLYEASKAFYRDLDAISQRLDLPPMEEWDQLPAGIDDPNPIDWHQSTANQEIQTLEEVQQQAIAIGKKLQKSVPFPARDAAKLLMALEVGEQKKVFTELVGQGLMGRAEVQLLTRYLMKGEDINEEDSALVEALRRLGEWLSRR
jgi:hypothetical protein